MTVPVRKLRPKPIQKKPKRPKPPKDPHPPTGDAQFDAIMAVVERNDVEPIALFLDAAAEVVPGLRQLFRDLSLLLRFLHAKGQKRGPGNPGGQWDLWQDPNYIAAREAERAIADWKRTTGKAKIPQELRTQKIDEAAAYADRMAIARDKKVDTERVQQILREPKRRRLPT